MTLGEKRFWTWYFQLYALFNLGAFAGAVWDRHRLAPVFVAWFALAVLCLKITRELKASDGENCDGD